MESHFFKTNKFIIAPIGFWSIIIYGLLMISCSGDEVYEPLSLDKSKPIAEIKILSIERSNEIKVQITPSQNATKYEFAIGSEADKDAFLGGTLGHETRTGNASTEHMFSELNPETDYCIYARAFIEDAYGPISSIRVTTFDEEKSIVVSTPQTGYQFVAFNFFAVPDYVYVEYKLVKEVSDDVIDAFEEEERVYSGRHENNDDKYGVEEVFREFTATYFDLEPDTEYYLLFRGRDRYNQYSRTFVYDTKTHSKANLPAIDIEVIEPNDFWLTRLRFTPNETTSKYFSFFTMQGSLENYYLSMLMFAGDYYSYILGQSSLPNTSTLQGNGEFFYVNEPMIPGILYETYILLFDKDNNPADLIVKRWEIPEDKSAGVAKMTAEVVPTDQGGKYTFTPNDETVAFVCETYTTKYINDNGGTTDKEREAWLYNDMLQRVTSYQYSTPGTNWHYRDFDQEYWPLEWEDNSGGDLEAGTELELVILPMNKNGLAGVGEMSRYPYKKL